MNKKTLILLTAYLVGTHAWAGSVTIPNTFVDGTTASASEVNANFGAVKTAVDDNDSRITTNTSDINTNAANITANTNAISAAVPQVLLKDANGVTIGRVIGMEKVGWPYVLTDKGYRTFIRIGKGRVSLFPESDLGFASPGCIGMAYQSRGMYLGAVFLPTPNVNEFYDGGGVLLHTPSDAVQEMVNIKSVRRSEDGACDELGINGEDHELFPAFPNNPNITGIENTAYPFRMLIK